MSTDENETTSSPKSAEALRIEAWSKVEKALRELEPRDAALVIKSIAILYGVL